MLVSILAIGLCLGALDIGVAARAQHEGAAYVAGYLLAPLSLRSAGDDSALAQRRQRWVRCLHAKPPPALRSDNGASR